MAYRFQQSPNYWEGRAVPVATIVIHWWDKPEKKPRLDGVVSWFLNTASEVSAHYVVSDEDVVQMVNEGDRAWHAGYVTNQLSIGIEIDPNTPGNTYQTVGRLVREIRSRHGNLPLIRHRDVPGASTACPGNIDVNLIERIAQGEEMYQGKTAEQWAKDAAAATRIAETRAALLAKVVYAAGVNPNKAIELAEVERAVKLIDDRNKVITQLKKDVAGVPKDKATEALRAVKEALKEIE